MRSGLLATACALLLAGCGLAETTAVATTEAAAAAEQVKQGKELEAKVQRDVEAANKTAADAIAQAESAN
jgi:hypothetical protein